MCKDNDETMVAHVSWTPKDSYYYPDVKETLYMHIEQAADIVSRYFTVIGKVSEMDCVSILCNNMGDYVSIYNNVDFCDSTKLDLTSW